MSFSLFSIIRIFIDTKLIKNTKKYEEEIDKKFGK